MATMISPGQYKISGPNEGITSSISWNSLIGVSTSQVLKLSGLYYGASGLIDMGGGSDTIIINTNGKVRLDLRNTEYVYAGVGKALSLQLMNASGSTFTTDGTIREIIGGGTGKHHVTFEHGLANAGTRPNDNSVVTVSLGAGTQDVVNFEQATRVVNLPGGGTYTQNAWVIYATATGYAAYNNFRDYTVNVLSNVEQLTYNGDVYVPGSTNLLISNVTFSWAANAAATSFIVNVPSVNVYFRTGGNNEFLDNNAVFVTSNNVGLAQEAVIAPRAVAAEGVIRVEAGVSTDDSTEHLYIGTLGADTLTAPSTSPTALYGFAGNDNLSGNTGADTLFGGLGEDTLSGGAGDSVFGNEDDDLIVGFGTGASVDGGSEFDTLQVDSTAAIAGLAAATNGALTNVEMINAANAAAGVTINVGNQTEGFTIIGSGEVDTITVSQGADTVATGARADTVSFGTAGSLAANMDTLTDYEDDILDFGGDAVLVGAGGSAVAGVSVTTSANGKVTFAAADDTLAEKIAAIRADTRLDVANAVTVFSDGDDSYVYYAGAAAGNSDDQIIKLIDQASLDKLVIASGNVTLDTEPPSTGLTTTLSLLPTTSSWTGAPGGAAPTGFTPGNDGNANPAQGDGVNGNTNQLIRNAGGNFGTHVSGGDDTYGLVSVPAGLWSTGLNMFGTTYTDLYIGTNGYVTFGKGFSGYSPSGIAGFTRSPMIAAQYDDLYTDQGARNITNGAGSGTSQNSHNMYYFIDGDKMVFTWDNVGLYSSASSTTSANRGSAFQIIIHKPTGDLVADQDFGMEIRYEEVTQQSSGATAGWTAGDQVNYGLVNNSVVLSTVATSSSNVGVNGVWAWEVNGGVVAAPYFVPDIGIGAGGVNVASLTFRNALPTGFNITGDGNGYGFAMNAAVANGINSSATLKTIASPHWNLWKEQYKDGVATITVTPTGAANGAPVTMDINIFNNGLDTVTRVGGAAGTTLSVSATSSDLNTASNSDISTITTVQATAAVSINLSNQTENFTIAGSAGADTLVGGQGNDAINGGLGNDSLTGGLGNDTFTVGLTGGTDTITDLGVGGDEISMSSGIIFATLGANWTPTAATNKTSASASVNVNGYNINLTNVANTGGSGWTLTNSSTAASMTGGPLNDSITGGTGNDTLSGGTGNDVLTGGGGNDSVNGGAGNDTIYASTGSDVLNGDDDNDRIEFDFGLGQSPANVTLNGGNGTDTLYVWSGGAADITLGDAAFAHVSTMENLSLIQSGGYGVSVTLGSAASTAFASGVTVTAGVGTTVTVNGSAFTPNMSVTASINNDTLIGGSGDDTLIGGLGNDSLTGGAGIDTFTVASGTDTITDLGNGVDIVTVSGGATVNATLASSWTATASSSNAGTASVNVAGSLINLASVTGANGWTITNSGTAASMTGSGNNDTISGGANNDTLIGGAGNDSLTGGIGNDTFTVATGTDTITDLGNGVDILTVSAGATANATLANSWTATASSSNAGTASINVAGNTLNLGSASGANGWTATNSGVGASMTGSSKNDTMTGGTGNDTINGGIGADSLSGGDANDTLSGGEGNDTILGGNGDDHITGGDSGNLSLNDSLAGGAGNDWFSFDVGASVLMSAAAMVDGGGDTDTLFAWNGGGGGNVNLADSEFATVANMEILTMSAGGTATVTLNSNANTAFGSGITITNAISAGKLVVNGASATVAITATGGSANDTITGGSAADTIVDGSGVDEIRTGGGADIVNLTNDGVTAIDRIVYTTAGGFASDGPAAGVNTGYDIITGFDGGDKDKIIFTGFTGTINNQDANIGDEYAADNASQVLVVRDSTVGVGGSLTDDLAAALDSAFNLTGLSTAYHLFSVRAADLDANPATNQYWIGILNNVGPDDAVIGAEIQVLALVTVLAVGIPDADNFGVV